MASIIDRLLGRTEQPAAKAVTGSGAYALTYMPPIASLSRNPYRLMSEAEALFHSQPWVNAAERALGGRFARMPWHLEQADGDTVDDSATPQEQAVRNLLERPSPGKTWRQLRSITFRHLGLAGNALWYLDAVDRETGVPQYIRYVNPCRMTPITDDAGDVMGWVLNHKDNPLTPQGSQPIPFDAAEIIHFTLEEPDWGVLGIGIPEAAQRKIDLDRYADMHTAGTLSSGGRLSGLISPKTGEAMTDDQWVQFARDWRRIAEDPDAAKRLQIAKVPLDFTQTVASPKDLQLNDISKGSRDDIFTLWGIPLSKAPTVVPGGLNADLSKGDEKSLWDTIQGRSVGMDEKIQNELLDRLGLDLTYVSEYPEFDDDTGLYDNAVKAKAVPLTNNERRAIVGLDPIEDDTVGNLIFIAQDMVPLDASPPQPVPPPLAPFTRDTPPEANPLPQPEGKARLNTQTLRARAEKRFQPRITEAMRVVLAEQRAGVIAKVRKHYSHLAAKGKDVTAWWDDATEDARLERALLPIYDDLATETVRNIRALSVFPAKADVSLEAILKLVRTKALSRITGINQTTRDAIAKLIEAGIADGLAIDELGAGISDAAAFNAARADLVARTETMLAYNESALTSYRQFGAETVQAIDGDVDEECAARDGKEYSVEDAYGITDHPNGTLDWLPVVR